MPGSANASRLAVVRRGVPVDVEAILEHLDSSGLSRYDMPEFILQLSEVPLTARRKLLKRELVRRVADCLRGQS